MQFLLFIQDSHINMLNFFGSRWFEILSDSGLTIGCEKKEMVAFKRDHSLKIKLVVGFHFAHIAGLIVFKLTMNPNGTRFGFAWFPRHPTIGEFLPVFANPAGIGQAPGGFELLVDGVDALDAIVAYLVAAILIFRLNLKKPVSIDIAD